MKPSQSLVKVAKKVVSNLAEMGIDEAGQLVCGARWDFFKKVLSPVIEALAERFPDLLMNTETAEKAANELEYASDLRTLLEEEYRKHFAELKEGHTEILSVLLQQSELLGSLKEASERGSKELAKIGSDVKEALTLLHKKHAEVSISSDEIPVEVDSLQRDAMQWIEKNRPVSAQRRLDDARNLIRNEIEKNPQDVQLLTLRGYIEKSQAQVYFLIGEVDQARNALETAANYFNAAHKAEEKDASALNGLANIYFYVGDFDTAVRFSTMALRQAPHYAEAALDLSLALERKLRRGDSAKEIMPILVPCYEMLAAIIPQYPGFTASQLKYVQTRLAQLKESSELDKSFDNASKHEKDAKELFSLPGGRDALYAPIHDALGKRNYKKVIELIGEKLPFMNDNPNLYALRSLAYDGLEFLDKALSDSEVFLQKAPHPNIAHFLHHATILSRLDRHEDAMVATRKARELASKEVDVFDWCFDWLAAYELIDKAKHAYELAAKVFEEQCKEDPYIPEIQCNLLVAWMYNEQIRLTGLAQSTPHLSSAIEEIKQILDTYQNRLSDSGITTDENNI